MYQIDLNSDMGESFGAYSIGNDDEIIKYVTTANVACGWHGGDPMVMDKVVKKAAEAKVAMVPGTAFGAAGEGYLRLSYASSYENLAEACARIKAAVEKLRSK